MFNNIKENEDDDSSQSSRLPIDQDIVLTTDEDINKVVSAFENIDNYGTYVSSMRKNPKVEKMVGMHFGTMDSNGKTLAHVSKVKLEKERGEKFPVKTQQAVEDVVRKAMKDLLPSLVSYEIEGNSLIFPKNSNPNKEYTEKIIQTVMKNAGDIPYKIKLKSSIKESKQFKQIRQIVKEELKNFSLK